MPTSHGGHNCRDASVLWKYNGTFARDIPMYVILAARLKWITLVICNKHYWMTAVSICVLFACNSTFIIWLPWKPRCNSLQRTWVGYVMHSKVLRSQGCQVWKWPSRIYAMRRVYMKYKFSNRYEYLTWMGKCSREENFDLVFNIEVLEPLVI